MSGGEPLWRRVAGLYLSGIPADAKDRVSTRAPGGGAGAAELVEDPTTEIIMLGEALDLVTLAQGYRSPAVPLLLRALIRVVRQVSAERADSKAAEEAVAAAAAETPADENAGEATSAEGANADGGDGETAAPATERPESPPETPAETPSEPTAEPGTGTAAATMEAVEQRADAVTTADTSAALEERVTQTDRKVTALTAAVGQLVNVLQRRTRDGGGVERRATPRLPGTHATVFVHDRPYEVINWSQGGFLIRIAETDRFSRGGFDFHFVLEMPDETVEFQGRAQPVRIERTTLAAEFATQDEDIADKIGEIVTRLAGPN